jgi:hypothetical protein
LKTLQTNESSTNLINEKTFKISKSYDTFEFANACIKEVNGHIQAEQWKVIYGKKIPDDIDVLPSDWSMHQKRNLTCLSTIDLRLSTIGQHFHVITVGRFALKISFFLILVGSSLTAVHTKT